MNEIYLRRDDRGRIVPVYYTTFEDANTASKGTKYTDIIKVPPASIEDINLTSIEEIYLIRNNTGRIVLSYYTNWENAYEASRDTKLIDIIRVHKAIRSIKI